MYSTAIRVSCQINHYVNQIKKLYLSAHFIQDNGEANKEIVLSLTQPTQHGIDLKTVKLLPEAMCQLNMYLNYYAAEVNDSDENPPIGIILCTDKDSVGAEYALGGLSNNIFASRYTYVIPNKEELIAQVEVVLKHSNRRARNDRGSEELTLGALRHWNRIPASGVMQRQRMALCHPLSL